ncbi:MAG: TIGR04282 family arsenosugar biosynthesis glycosyltransferase [Moraxellaceae bacterium]|nr:TIGR04282 family arsenosugar biosynthesis glycosyltransferase [Moraxellaceae bacterium]MDZ4386446.1 TIGR04282 family arsenosugar biosynthesis glycosyltransferase [Moraxellaceae bacterium]
MHDTCVVIMAKQPLPGLAKTRIAATLGEEYAAILAEQLLLHTLNKVQQMTQQTTFSVCAVLCVAPQINPYFEHLAQRYKTALIVQVEGDLGARMQAAASYALNLAQQVIIIGTDCPELNIQHITQARKSLDQADVYLQPAHDGGYVLVALKESLGAVFEGKPWSTPVLMTKTLSDLTQAGIRYALGEYLNDIDEADDLVYLPSSFSRPQEVMQ